MTRPVRRSPLAVSAVLLVASALAACDGSTGPDAVPGPIVVVREQRPAAGGLATNTLLLPPGSGARTLPLGNVRYAGGLAWTGSDRVRFVGWYTGADGYHHFEVALRTGVVTRVAALDPFVPEGVPSPDGRRVAFVHRDRQIPSGGIGTIVEVQDAATRATTNAWYTAGDADGAFGCVAWSRDGSQLAFDFRDTVRVLGATGGSARVVAALFGGPDECAWSPDGQRLALAGMGMGFAPRLVMARADGGTPVTLDSTMSFRNSLTWSPDGRTLAVAVQPMSSSTAGSIELWDASGQRRTLAGWGVYRMDWMPEGGTLVVHGERWTGPARPGADIWRVPLAGGAPTLVAPVASPMEESNVTFAIRRP